MFKTTKMLKERMNQHELIPKRLREMKNFYEGETMYIVTCGPSLNDIDDSYLRNKLSDKLVLTNKQAYNKIGDIVDFHTLNMINFQPYKYKSDDTIVIWELFEQWHPDWIIENGFKCDLMLPVVGNHIPNPQRMDESQAGQLSFDEWTLDKTIYRQFGPGMMYEIIFHLPVYFGCKEVIVVSWDIGDLSLFSGDDPNEEIFEDHYYSTKENKYGDIHSSKCGATYREQQVVIESTKFLKEWLNSKGIGIKIVSNKSSAHESIERINL